MQVILWYAQRQYFYSENAEVLVLIQSFKLWVNDLFMYYEIYPMASMIN